MSAILKLNAILSFSKKPSIFELSNINLKHKISELKKVVTKKVNIEQDKYELIYCGCILEDEMTLESYGLKSGVTIHVITKKENKNAVEPITSNDFSMIMITSTFISLGEIEIFRNAFQRVVNREDFNENLIKAIPALKSDLVSVAMANDPILMLHFADTTTVERLAKSHPTLVRVAQYVATEIREEVLKISATSSTTPQAGSSNMMLSPSMPFNMDSSIEMDDMDSPSSSEPTTPQSNVATIPNFNSSGITITQLAAALANARSNPSGSTSTSSSSRIANHPRITVEMFSQAMQQAFESTESASSTGVPPSPVTSVSPTTPQSQTQNYQNQLNLMHEMGLLDDVVNVQALLFTNGDVQAAIELVFSGFGDN